MLSLEIFIKCLQKNGHQFTQSQKVGEEGILSNLFNETSIALIPKPVPKKKKKAFKYPIINKKIEMMIKNFPPQRLLAQMALQEVLLNFQKKRSKFQGIVNFCLIPTTQKSRKRAHFMR